MIKKIFFVFVAAIMTFAVAVFVHLGAYKSPHIAVRSIPAMTLLYVEHVGPYNEVAPLMDKVQLWAIAHHLSCNKTFGFYLDNPQTTEERRLRSHVGCVLTSTAPTPDALCPTPSAEGSSTCYKVEQFPAGRYIWASFDGSPAIGPFKVYPRIYDFARGHRLKTDAASLEVYTVRGQKNLTTEYYVAFNGASHVRARSGYQAGSPNR